MRVSVLALVTLSACGTPAPQPTPPPAPKTARAPAKEPEPAKITAPTRIVSTGYTHQCCLGPDKAIVCNGSSKHGLLEIPKREFTEVSAGLYMSCGANDEGIVGCWGSKAPRLSLARNTRYHSVAAGSAFACALRDDNHAECWGADDFQTQLDGRFVYLVAGHDHVCGLRESGEVACAGRPGREEMLCKDLEDVPADVCQPGQKVARSWTQAPPGLRAKHLAAGSSHNCAQGEDGKVVCWGAWGHGDGNTIWSAHTQVPDNLSPKIQKLTGGGGVSCALLEDKTVTCWGNQESPPGRFIDIDGGSSGLCGVRENGEMECFRYSSFAGLKMDTTPLVCATK